MTPQSKLQATKYELVEEYKKKIAELNHKSLNLAESQDVGDYYMSGFDACHALLAPEIEKYKGCIDCMLAWAIETDPKMGIKFAKELLAETEDEA